jgi:hypothetical protein
LSSEEEVVIKKKERLLPAPKQTIKFIPFM